VNTRFSASSHKLSHRAGALQAENVGVQMVALLKSVLEMLAVVRASLFVFVFQKQQACLTSAHAPLRY
jgi:hypothetical protein